MEPNRPLSARLESLMEGSFFRPLSRPSAPIYIDCADRLTLSADDGGQLTHSDTLALIRDVLAMHPKTQLDEDEGAQFNDLRQRAGQIFNKLLEAGWLQERTVSLDEQWVLLTPRLRPLIRLLRELAQNKISELRDFAATLTSICRTLLAEGGLSPERYTPEEYRHVIKELVDRVERAGDQMHGVEILIIQHEERQRGSSSASETLERLLVEFHAGEHMVCYDALQEGNLVPRLRQARAVVLDALANPFSKQRLAEGLAKFRDMETADSSTYEDAAEMLQRLEKGLSAISAKQRIIDGRMADFSRMSAQRYEYQTQMRGKRPEQVKAYMVQADELHHGESFSDLAREQGMSLLCPDIELFFGFESLARQRRPRPPADLTLVPTPDAKDILDANLSVVTAQRAERLMQEYLPEPGMTLQSDALKLTTEDDLLDLLAVLTFERVNGERTKKQIHWQVDPARAHNGLEPEQIPMDSQSGHMVERFTVKRMP
jgi:hypothetical protein